MKTMPAFFSWVPGRCREATEEGKKRLTVPLDEIRPADEHPHPDPSSASERGVFLCFSAIFAVIEMGIVE